MAHVRQGDLVVVIAGKEKGKTGKVLRILNKKDRVVVEGLRFDEKFRFYRTADIELSFQIKAMGHRATVTKIPVAKHEHRVWSNTPEDERARLSKRNFYRFLDRWRGRTDLLVSSARGG